MNKKGDFPHLIILALAAGILASGMPFIFKGPHTASDLQTSSEEASGPAPVVNVVSAPIGHVGPRWSSSYSYPYPIQWTGWNRANIALTHALVVPQMSTSSTGKVLAYSVQLLFKVDTTGSEFCNDYFHTSMRRLKNEDGDLAEPNEYPHDCVGPSTTKEDIESGFLIPVSEVPNKQFIVQVFDAHGEMQTFFTLTLQKDFTVQAEPAPTGDSVPVSAPSRPGPSDARFGFPSASSPRAYVLAVKAGLMQPSSDLVIFDHVDADHLVEYELFYQQNDGISRLIFRRNVVGVAGCDLVFPTTLSTAEFTNVIASYDGNYTHLYVDDKQVGTAACGSGDGSNWTSFSNGLTLMANNAAGGFNGSFLGTIDEFFIEDRTWNQDDVDNYWNTFWQKNRQWTPGMHTRALYHLNNDANDSTASGRSLNVGGHAKFAPAYFGSGFSNDKAYPDNSYLDFHSPNSTPTRGPIDGIQ